MHSESKVWARRHFDNSMHFYQRIDSWRQSVATVSDIDWLFVKGGNAKHCQDRRGLSALRIVRQLFPRRPKQMIHFFESPRRSEKRQRRGEMRPKMNEIDWEKKHDLRISPSLYKIARNTFPSLFISKRMHRSLQVVHWLLPKVAYIQSIYNYGKVSIHNNVNYITKLYKV